MTTPRAPEGGDGVEHLAELLYHADVVPLRPLDFRKSVAWADCPDSSREEYRHLARVAATAERQRLANMASEEDREMISAFRNAGGPCTCPQHIFCEHEQRALRIQTTLLATLTARRAAAMEEAARVCDDLAAMWQGEARRTNVLRYAQEFGTNAEVLRVAANNIRALAAAPPATAGEGVDEYDRLVRFNPKPPKHPTPPEGGK